MSHLKKAIVIFSLRSHQDLRFDTKYGYKYRRTPYDPKSRVKVGDDKATFKS